MMVLYEHLAFTLGIAQNTQIQSVQNSALTL